MYIKKSIFAALAFILCAGADAGGQEAAPVAPEQHRQMLQQIAAASAGMESLACDFEQAKVSSMLSGESTSTGKMYYRRRDSCLRWEYAPPLGYTFILNGKKALMLTGGKSVSDAKLSRFFREMVGIMVSGISGSGLTDTKSFDAACYGGAAQWEVVLTPRRKELKKMFDSIKLTFNLKDYTADRIELQESNGDVTTIRLLGKQLNVEIDDAKFNVD
ncbi:MAG: outer membrane lipoprotein carrier protein LolA [Prevotellaceae bacterium]|jgi:outer membrane lipoprotein-sorting protein|nr:outer membrane lipoprotein carrier protein LolA [Prevotellaceae bacterium]